MPVEIPEKVSDLLTWEKKAFAQLAIVLGDGTPHVSPLWFDWDGTHIVLNTARGRVKDKVMSKRRNVALSIGDPADPYRYLLIRGTIVEETEAGGYDTICRLNEKYKGKREFPRVPGQVRVTYKVLPERVFASSG